MDIIKTKTDFKIAFSYNKRPEEYHYETDSIEAEYDPLDTINAIVSSIQEVGYNVVPIEFNADFAENLKKENPDLVFNIAEGLSGEEREAQAPAILEFLGYKYVGSGPLAKAIALNKAMAKRVMEQYGVKTAPFKLFSNPITKDDLPNIPYPLIVKPCHEGSSIGIDNNAVVDNSDALIDRVNYVLEKYNQPALVEQFIVGREFTQAIIGNEDPILLPIIEINYEGLPPGILPFSSFEVKYTYDRPSTTICPAKITAEEEKKIQIAALRAYRALGMRDYARVDMRMNKNGEVFVLEVNASPGLAPGVLENNSLPKSIKVYGWTYTQMIDCIINLALKRYNIIFESPITK